MVDIIVPDSKSEFIRILLIASIFNKSVFNNQFVIKYHTDLCDDVLSTINTLPIFGCTTFVDLANRQIFIYPTNESIKTVSVGKSGTLFRILHILQSEFDGIVDKTVDVIVQETLKSRNFDITHSYTKNIHNIEFDTKQSSQSVSGLIIGATHEIVSKKFDEVSIKILNMGFKSYIELTIYCIQKLLNKFVSISFNDNTITIKQKNEFGPQLTEYTVCGDATNTLALFSVGYWLRKQMRLWNMPKPHIPDFDILQKCYHEKIEASHYFDFHWFGVENLEKDIDLNNNPNTVPYWCLMECKNRYIGEKLELNNISGIKKLVNKESNCLAVLRVILGEFGIEIDYDQTCIYIKQTDTLYKPITEHNLNPHNDYRIAQIIAILSFAMKFNMSKNLFSNLRCCISKSYPNFMYDLIKINESVNKGKIIAKFKYN